MNSKQHKVRLIYHILVMPLIYSLIIPVFILDFWVEIYHRICFVAYDIPYVKRSKYIKIDRHKLSYLQFYEKLNCVYCGYANGVLHYTSVIAGETEKYWCGIKHKSDAEFVSPPHHDEFIDYGDEEAYRRIVNN
ncbi:MAG: hypothetical protein IPG89_13290 [Bacteroidetes bacterium]|nr:hypothetical protein [Bacteroidota bacterium]